MFTKLDMADNEPVLTNITGCCHDDVISDVPVERFRLDRIFMKLDAWT